MDSTKPHFPRDSQGRLLLPVGLLENFWRKVKKAEAGECWEWIAYRRRDNYGQFGLGSGHMVRAHRVAFELAIGAIPLRYFVHHTCSNRACVNPAHLKLFTPEENTRVRDRGANHERPVSYRATDSRKPLRDRLLAAITQPDGPSGCWLWSGNTTRQIPAYGVIAVDGKTRKAHRASYEAFKGPIPDGLCVLHDCDVGLCIAPHHLHLGTLSDNMNEAYARGRKESAFRRLFPRARGEHNSQAKLTDAQRQQMVEKRMSGVMTKDLALEYGLSRSAVQVSVRKSRGRWAAPKALPKRECTHGHPLDSENTYVGPNGDRACKVCRSEANRRYASTHCRERVESTSRSRAKRKATAP